MQKDFYKVWKENRVNRIIHLLGKEWFEGKEILELGACSGAIGNEFRHLGADLSFSEVNPQFLKDLHNTFPNCPVYEIDQNKTYNLNRSFDLVLHLGVLYHIENWEQDLECALNHTNLMVLDTRIVPPQFLSSQKTHQLDPTNKNRYSSFNKTYRYIDESSLINCFNRLKVKYLRIDTPSMTTPYMLDNTSPLDGSRDYLKFLYGWDPNNLPPNLDYFKDNKHYHTTTFQTYLILK